ncbi:BnaC04g36380D [Brassica napus]|uniref:(rape) hypothetical protein n=1 Tax=Brassica napus TaxID=3708 RepID=A0A078G6P0_BRANA|nr:uncharacterized protein LOC106446645 [Brassica napus]CAF1861504.1 unnamed protein product [Brassica napus]CDY20318.1 BnaC04g36380D [Brassica napus]
MQRCQDQRINLGELKGHIVKKIGVERSKKYFYYLSRFLCHKLAKREFDKSCFRVLGRENLSLHNHLIRSILRNATVSKSPPTVQDLARPVQSGGDGSLVPYHNNQNGPVWSNGKVEHMLQQPVCSNVGLENGDLSRFDDQRSGRYGREGEFLGPSKNLGAVNVSVSSPLVAPLGIPICSASVGGRTVPVSTVMSCLPETEMVRKRMESIAVAHGLEGVSMECANTLNAMLDVYLKKLIKSCTDLVGARSTKQQSQNSLQDHHYSVSLLDFRTAMELNPQQLGENWPTLRERISVRSFEEQDLEV